MAGVGQVRNSCRPQARVGQRERERELLGGAPVVVPSGVSSFKQRQVKLGTNGHAKFAQRDSVRTVFVELIRTPEPTSHPMSSQERKT
jgi:hypothetical protein